MNSKLIKLIFLAKFLGLFGFLVYHFKLIKVGEKKSLAQEAPKEPQASGPKKEEPKVAEKPSAEDKVAPPVLADTKKEEAKPPEKVVANDKAAPVPVEPKVEPKKEEVKPPEKVVANDKAAPVPVEPKKEEVKSAEKVSANDNKAVAAATEPKKEEEKKDPAKTAEKPAPSDKNSEPNPVKEDMAKDKEKTSKFFQDLLLDLPPMDTSNAKKEDLTKYIEIAESIKTRVNDRISLLNSRAKSLEEIEGHINEKLLKLDEERKFLANTLNQEKQLQKDRVDKLVKLFETMDPKKAAQMLESLDKDLIVTIFKALKEKTVTKFLEAMPASKSVEISHYFARIGSAREYDLLKEVNLSLRNEFQNKCVTPPQG